MVDPDIETIAEKTEKKLDERDIDISDLLESSDTPTFDMDMFLRNNYKLFAIMGIFGAVSIYLTTISLNLSSVNRNIVNIGVVSSLLIFLLIAINILENLYNEADFSKLHFVHEVEHQQIKLTLFSTSLVLLVTIISYITLSLPRALTLFVSVLTAVAGWQSFGIIMDRIPTRNYPEYSDIQTFIRTIINYFVRLSLISIILIIIPVFILAYIFVDYGSINIPMFLYEYIFNRGQGILPLVLAFFIGMGIASVMNFITIFRLYSDIK